MLICDVSFSLILNKENTTPTSIVYRLNNKQRIKMLNSIYIFLVILHSKKLCTWDSVLLQAFTHQVFVSHSHCILNGHRFHPCSMSYTRDSQYRCITCSSHYSIWL